MVVELDLVSDFEKFEIEIEVDLNFDFVVEFVLEVEQMTVVEPEKVQAVVESVYYRLYMK